MPETCEYTIGDISIVLTSDTLEGYYDTPSSFDNFRAQDPADVNLNIHFNHFPDLPIEEVTFDSGLGWCQYICQGRHVLRVQSSQRDPRLVGVFSQDFHSGDIFSGISETDPGNYIFPFSFPLGELFMTNLLGTGYGVILHSCGVIHQGQGLLFAGIGGAGKSTTARQWQVQDGARVINDDHVIVRKVGGQFRIYGTPWHGREGLALAEDAPLKRVFILKHADANQLLPLLPSQAALRITCRVLFRLFGVRRVCDFLCSFWLNCARKSRVPSLVFSPIEAQWTSSVTYEEGLFSLESPAADPGSQRFEPELRFPISWEYHTSKCYI